MSQTHTHERAHDHRHSHELESWRDAVATLVLLAVGFAKLALGNLIGNPTVVADGGHTLFDSLYTLATWLMKRTVGKSPSHRLQRHLPIYVGMAICAVTMAVVVVLTAVEALRPIDVSNRNLLEAIGIGLFGFGANLTLGSMMSHGLNATDKSNATHLLSDAYASLIIVVSAGCAWIARSVVGAEWARFAILCGTLAVIMVVLQMNVGSTIEIWRQLKVCIDEDRRHG